MCIQRVFEIHKIFYTQIIMISPKSIKYNFIGLKIQKRPITYLISIVGSLCVKNMLTGNVKIVLKTLKFIVIFQKHYIVRYFVFFVHNSNSFEQIVIIFFRLRDLRSKLSLFSLSDCHVHVDFRVWFKNYFFTILLSQLKNSSNWCKIGKQYNTHKIIIFYYLEFLVAKVV